MPLYIRKELSNGNQFLSFHVPPPLALDLQKSLHRRFLDSHNAPQKMTQTSSLSVAMYVFVSHLIKLEKAMISAQREKQCDSVE